MGNILFKQNLTSAVADTVSDLIDEDILSILDADIVDTLPSEDTLPLSVPIISVPIISVPIISVPENTPESVSTSLPIDIPIPISDTVYDVNQLDDVSIEYDNSSAKDDDDPVYDDSSVVYDNSSAEDDDEPVYDSSATDTESLLSSVADEDSHPNLELPE